MIQEGRTEDERTPDLRRCERIRWPRPIIERLERLKPPRGTASLLLPHMVDELAALSPTWGENSNLAGGNAPTVK
jgi:hypothetical protein